MRKNFVTAIAAITTFAIIGIVVTQFIWVERSIRLRAQQFDNAIYYGQLGVIDEIDDMRREKIMDLREMGVADSLIPFDAGLNYPRLLDSMIREEFGCLKIDEDFAWGIIDTTEKVVVYGYADESHRESLLHSTHIIPASSLYENQQDIYLSVFFPEEQELVIRKMILWILVLSGVFLLIVIIGFLVFINTILKQKHISEMKNDFINNMTHEFKTPISTISVASEMLMRPGVQAVPDKMNRYANVIFDENLRLRNQVEQVLNISMLEKSEFKLKVALIDVHKIIETSIDIFKVILKDKNGVVHADLYALRPVIEADEVHFINMFTNLLDNAVKYSRGRPEITIQTRDSDNGVIIRVSDNGIGINSEDQRHIFKKFFRVHTGDIHDVKGFGLGLFYVKTVIDAHEGNIKVVSELKKGSTFELYLPYKSSLIDHD